MCGSRVLADVNDHCHLGALGGRWWTKAAVTPTALRWIRKGIVNGVTVASVIMWSCLVEG